MYKKVNEHKKFNQLLTSTIWRILVYIFVTFSMYFKEIAKQIVSRDDTLLLNTCPYH